MRGMDRLLLVVGLLAAVALPAPVRAQWTNPYSGSTWNNPSSSLIETMLRGQVNQKALLQPAKPATTGPRLAPARPARITYRPSPTRVPEEIAASLFPKPADQAELVVFLRDAKASYVAEAAKAGRANDLGHALTFFVTANYVVFHGEDPSDAATEALNLQLDALLRSSESLVKASDVQKQQLADHLACTAFFVLAGLEQGKQKGGAEGAEQVKLYRALAAQNLKQLLKLDVARLLLTEQGLRER